MRCLAPMRRPERVHWMGRSPLGLAIWLAIAVNMMALGAAVDAAVYRWVDDSGRVQFTDRPPMDQEGEQVEIRQPAATPKAGALSDQQRRRQQQKLLEVYRQDRETKQELVKKRKQDAQKRAIKCRYAQDRLKSYRDASSLYEPMSDGSRRTLSPQELAAALKKSEKAVEAWCD